MIDRLNDRFIDRILVYLLIDDNVRMKKIERIILLIKLKNKIM